MLDREPWVREGSADPEAEAEAMGRQSELQPLHRLGPPVPACTSLGGRAR